MTMYNSKLQQLVEEINYKYCPDMESKTSLIQVFNKGPTNLTPTSLPGTIEYLMMRIISDFS